MNKDLKIKSRKEDHKETHKGTKESSSAGYSKRFKRLEKRRGKSFYPQKSLSSIKSSNIITYRGHKNEESHLSLSGKPFYYPCALIF